MIMLSADTLRYSRLLNRKTSALRLRVLVCHMWKCVSACVFWCRTLNSKNSKPSGSSGGPADQTDEPQQGASSWARSCTWGLWSSWHFAFTCCKCLRTFTGATFVYGVIATISTWFSFHIDNLVAQLHDVGTAAAITSHCYQRPRLTSPQPDQDLHASSLIPWYYTHPQVYAVNSVHSCQNPPWHTERRQYSRL